MKGEKRTRSACLALALLVVALPALAADGDPEAVNAGPAHWAAVKVFGGGIDLEPAVRYERAVVTVSGVGRTFRLEFDASTRPTIEPFDAEGQLLPDGVYRWELELVPDATTAQRLRASAAAHGGVALRPWRPQSGTFAVAGGLVATPGIVEESERLERAAAARRGGRREVAAQQLGGQVFGAEKNLAGRAAAVDTDEAATGGAGDEASILKAQRASSERVASRELAVRSTHTGPDSDHRSAELGASLEKALVAVPKAHEIEQQNQRPRADGSNGRPRSDR